jgi:hypothetical protein
MAYLVRESRIFADREISGGPSNGYNPASMNAQPTSRWLTALGLPLLVGCAPTAEQMAAQFMARMDAAPPGERVPNWEVTRALMLRQPPKVGDAAPDFVLTTCDGAESIRLSEFREGRPVVLIFGSWT